MAKALKVDKSETHSGESKSTLTSVPSTLTVATSAFDVPMTKSRTTNVRAFIVESFGYFPPGTPLHHVNTTL